MLVQFHPQSRWKQLKRLLKTQACKITSTISYTCKALSNQDLNLQQQRLIRCGNSSALSGVAMAAPYQVWQWQHLIRCGNGSTLSGVAMAAPYQVWQWQHLIRCGNGSTLSGVAMAAPYQVWQWQHLIRCGNGFTHVLIHTASLTGSRHLM